MGIINISIRGSFKPRAERNFYAQTSGHAMAVHAAILWLTEQVLPAAERGDAALRAEGQTPDDNFAALDELHECDEQAVAKASAIMDEKIAEAGGLIPLLEKRQGRGGHQSSGKE